MSTVSTRGRLSTNGGASSANHSNYLSARYSAGGASSRASSATSVISADQQQQQQQQHPYRPQPPTGISWAAEDQVDDRSLTPSPVVPRGCKEFAVNHGNKADVAL